MGVELRKSIAGMFAMALCCAAIADESTEKKKPTPPTVVDEWQLDKDFAKIDQQWASLESVLKNDDYFAIKSEDVSAWSCGQQAGHVALVLNLTADSIKNMLANPDQNADGEISGMGLQLLKGGIIPRGVGKAPDGTRPDDPNRKDLHKTLNEAKEKWAALAKQTEEIAACPARAEHQTGMLKTSDWVRLMAIHTAHHLKIVRDILADSQDPKTKYFGQELFQPIEGE